MSNKYIRTDNIANGYNDIKNVQLGVVVSVDDSNELGRIKVRIPGQANSGGDFNTEVENLPWAYPFLQKFFYSQPKIGEGVFILTFSNQSSHADRLYIGPIISQLDKLDNEQFNASGVNVFTFAKTNVGMAMNTIPELTGIFPKKDDIAIQGRYNTDIILRKNEVLIRSGKFVKSQPTENNPYTFKFNTTTPGFIQIKNDVSLNADTNDIGSVLNIVGSKINLITHKDGMPRFNVTNQDEQISDKDILEIIKNAHPLPFGDLLVQYLILLKNAFINHVHNYNGIPPTDLIIGNMLPLQEFKNKAEDLEVKMLSKNIKIN